MAIESFDIKEVFFPIIVFNVVRFNPVENETNLLDCCKLFHQNFEFPIDLPLTTS